MAETTIYLALRKIGIALGREKTTALGHEQGETSARCVASIFLDVFVKKLSAAASEELLVTRQAELHGRMRRIESELRMIHCFLAQMETRYDNKQVLQSWIGEARKLGCLVEQTMDEYIVHILHKKGVGKKLLDVPAFALASRRLVAQLKEIEVELEHLSKMKKRWVQVDSQISKYHEDIGSSIDFPHLRTLIAGEDAASCLPSIPASLPSKHKYITVLELQGSQIKELPYNIGYHLFNLRYLGLRNIEIRELPYSMHRLYSLQTLDLKWSGIQELPSWIGNLTTLRHLFADNLIDKSQTEFLFFRSLRARKGVKHLKELQTLETVQTSTFFENNVSHLTQLSSLCVGNVEGRSCKTLFASLSKISSLSSLTVSACHSKEELRFQTLTSDHLKRLVVRGRLFNKTFECPIFMSKSLQSLELSWCKLWEDSLLELSNNLCKLVSLSLHRVSGISQLVFQKNSFAKLRRLVLRKIDAVTDLKILDGSLESLEVLHVESLDSIRELQNIQDLSKILSVRDLYFPKLISLHRGTDDIDGAVTQHL